MDTPASVRTGPVHIPQFCPAWTQSPSMPQAWISVWTLHPAAPTYWAVKIWGVTTDRETGVPGNCPSVIYRPPKLLQAAFSVKLHCVEKHPSWNIRPERLLVQIPHFVEKETAA